MNRLCVTRGYFYSKAGAFHQRHLVVLWSVGAFRDGAVPGMILTHGERVICGAWIFVMLACGYPGQREVSRGNELASAQKFEEALAAFREAARIDPRAARPRQLAGHALLAVRRFREARAAYEEALQRDPKGAPEAKIGLARIDAEEGSVDLAILHLGEILSTEPRNTYALLSRATLAMRRARPADQDMALGDTARAVSIDPRGVAALYTRGCALLFVRKPAEAEEAFQLARALHPESPLGPYGLARLAATRADKVAVLINLREAQRRSSASGAWESAEVRSDPAFAFLDGDPDFTALLSIAVP